MKAAQQAGKQVRAAYVPDTNTGTRWFADKSVWVHDGDRFLPFITRAAAEKHGKGEIITYEQAVGAA